MSLLQTRLNKKGESIEKLPFLSSVAQTSSGITQTGGGYFKYEGEVYQADAKKSAVHLANYCPIRECYGRMCQHIIISKLPDRPSEFARDARRGARKIRCR